MKDFFLEIALNRKKGLAAFFLRPLLYLLSLIYGLLVKGICWVYKRGILPGYRPQAKVISVGNITLGGTGKTPLVEFLAEALLRKGKRVVVLSRGYSLDEPRMLENKIKGLRVFTGRDRIKTAKEAQDALDPEVMILDDGFQHWRLKRDLDIVLLNSRNYFGNRSLIPRGILREPPSSLARADVIVISKVDSVKDISLIKNELGQINPRALIVECAYKPECVTDAQGKVYAWGIIENKNICLLSGIADPDYFKKTASDLGARIVSDQRFPDHHQYHKGDIEKIVRACRKKNVDTIVTTEKDLTRLPLSEFASDIKILILKIKLVITHNEESLFNRVFGLLAG
ncbi:MAG: tetraacyldisaccharide 4'-kinase [Candidatus Omnitrophota bacterium]|nr:tetraacyldisaccharide 4'-kinase [Candidatus Omnitrophota bacterium]